MGDVIRHELKILPEFFRSVIEGDKDFEIRYDADRGFQKGDSVKMRECGKDGIYTGRSVVVDIKYVTAFQQKDGFVVFGFKIVEIR